MNTPKIVGKIDLEKFSKNSSQENADHVRRTREILPDIEKSMAGNIALVQERVSLFEGAPKDFVSADGSINIEAFSSVYLEEEISFDKHIAQEKKKYHYRTFDPEVQKKYNTTDPHEIIKIIEEDSREKMRDGNISEDLLFLIMNKVAGDRYITLKSSEYDDFENGVDMILLDTQTDAVICTFDVTVSGFKSRMDHKIQRAKNRVDSGKGLFMKYAASFNENQEMKIGSIQNIPPLFLDLPKKELKKILHIMDFNIDSVLSDAEIELVSVLLDKLDNQIATLEENAAKNISYDSSRDFVAHLRATLDDLKKPE